MKDVTNNNNSWLDGGIKTVQLCYILNFIGLVFPLTFIISCVFAYIHRGNSESYLKTHYHYIIRTFFISLICFIISFILTFIFIGILLNFILVIWFIIRNVKGVIAITNKQPIINPNKLGF